MYYPVSLCLLVWIWQCSLICCFFSSILFFLQILLSVCTSKFLCFSLFFNFVYDVHSFSQLPLALSKWNELEKLYATQRPCCYSIWISFLFFIFFALLLLLLSGKLASFYYRIERENERDTQLPLKFRYIHAILYFVRWITQNYMLKIGRTTLRVNCTVHNIHNKSEINVVHSSIFSSTIKVRPEVDLVFVVVVVVVNFFSTRINLN